MLRAVARVAPSATGRLRQRPIALGFRASHAVASPIRASTSVFDRVPATSIPAERSGPCTFVAIVLGAAVFGTSGAVLSTGNVECTGDDAEAGPSNGARGVVGAAVFGTSDAVLSTGNVECAGSDDEVRPSDGAREGSHARAEARAVVEEPGIVHVFHLSDDPEQSKDIVAINRVRDFAAFEKALASCCRVRPSDESADRCAAQYFSTPAAYNMSLVAHKTKHPIDPLKKVSGHGRGRLIIVHIILITCRDHRSDEINTTLKVKLIKDHVDEVVLRVNPHHLNCHRLVVAVLGLHLFARAVLVLFVKIAAAVHALDFSFHDRADAAFFLWYT